MIEVYVHPTLYMQRARGGDTGGNPEKWSESGHRQQERLIFVCTYTLPALPRIKGSERKSREKEDFLSGALLPTHGAEGLPEEMIFWTHTTEREEQQQTRHRKMNQGLPSSACPRIPSHRRDR